VSFSSPNSLHNPFLTEGSVNYVVAKDQVLPKALEVARQILQNSPDSVQSTKRALLLAKKHNHEDTVLTHAWSPESKRLYKGENIKVSALGSPTCRQRLICCYLGRTKGICGGKPIPSTIMCNSYPNWNYYQKRAAIWRNPAKL
jgi:hypothetical protein